MELIETDLDTNKIETTLGDLIHAIGEAAQEAKIEEAELAPITMQVLEQLLARNSK
jgi:hypothetical protein